MKFRTLALPVSLLIALPLLHACGGSTDNQAHVRLINATNNYTALDLYANDDRIVAGIGVSSGSDYAGLDEDTYTLAVKNGDSSSTLVSLSASLSKEQHEAVLAYVTGGNLKAVALGEDEDAPDGGKAKLRVLNAASSELDSLDVYLVSKACSELSDTDVPDFQSITDVTSTGFTSFTAGSRRVCVTAADDPSDLRYEIPALALADQQIATLVLTRSSGGVLLDGLLANQQGTVTHYANPYARVRLAAGASAAATVGATVNDVTLATSTTSPTVGQYRLVAAGDLTTSVSIGGTAQSVTGLAAASGSDQTLLVLGTAASPTVNLLTDVNLPSSSSSKPVRIRLVNALNGSNGGLTLTLDGEIVGDGVTLGAASTPVNVAASTATSSLELSLAGTVLQTLADQTLTSGKVYTLFAMGDLGGTVTATLRADR